MTSVGGLVPSSHSSVDSTPPALHQQQHSPVSILTSHIVSGPTNAAAATVLLQPAQQQLSPPVSTESLPAISTLAQEQRPRKKLSFRDPEVMSTGGKDVSVAPTNNSVAPSNNPPAALKDQLGGGFSSSDSMENIALEVSVY